MTPSTSAVTGTPARRGLARGFVFPRWVGPVLFVLVGVLLLVMPALMSTFRLLLLAKYLCYAIVAVGIALAWGRGGMLTLGQGVFFGLGGYAMGMHLKLVDAGPGQLPDFMVWSGVEKLPALWVPFRNPAFALLVVVALPAVVATLLGLLVFRQRVRGAYFAVLSQALAAAFVLLIVGQQGLTGGTNGITNIRHIFGLNRYLPSTSRILYFTIVAVLGLVFLLAWQVTRSRFGKLLVAIRDGEDRVRFLGYDPARYKTIIFALSATMAGIAGALCVTVVSIFSPSLLDVVPSIMMLIGVAIGGRYSLAGAVAGTLLINYASFSLSVQFPSTWQYVLGGLFVAVIVWAPRGLAGLLADGRDALFRRFATSARPAADPSEKVPSAVEPTRPPPAEPDLLGTQASGGSVKVSDPA